MSGKTRTLFSIWTAPTFTANLSLPPGAYLPPGASRREKALAARAGTSIAPASDTPPSGRGTRCGRHKHPAAVLARTSTPAVILRPDINAQDKVADTMGFSEVQLEAINRRPRYQYTFVGDLHTAFLAPDLRRTFTPELQYAIGVRFAAMGWLMPANPNSWGPTRLNDLIVEDVRSPGRLNLSHSVLRLAIDKAHHRALRTDRIKTIDHLIRAFRRIVRDPAYTSLDDAMIAAMQRVVAAGLHKPHPALAG